MTHQQEAPPGRCELTMFYSFDISEMLLSIDDGER